MCPVETAVLADSRFAQDVQEGLTRKFQKTLPSSWLYDEVGSALFEVITVLPEYGLTRADADLIRRAAPDIIRVASNPKRIIELGSGTGTKTRHILQAAASVAAVDYYPIDISGAALESCALALKSVPNTKINPVEGQYLEGIDTALQGRCHCERALVLFLGSTIGNFSSEEAAAFLHDVRQKLAPGDMLLLGADLVKPRQQLIRAYDDSLGVTAAFNLNLLARINRELDGEFDLGSFAHEARYDEARRRIEMHLRSRIRQQVRIGALSTTISFAQDETIWTESSHKFGKEEICSIGERAGWETLHQWVDSAGGFTETLFRA